MHYRSSTSYLGFPCKDCKAPITALTIPLDMPTPIIDSGIVIKLTCPTCRADHEYQTTEVLRFEASQIF